MVNENKEVQITSDLEQAQESLGTELDEQKKPDPMVEMKNLLVEQNNKINGLQSKLDKGLNTIRKDSQDRAMQQAQTEVEKLKEGLEELEPSLRHYAEQQVKAAEDRVKTMSQDIPDSSLYQNSTSTSEMDEVRKIAEYSGVDSNDPGLNYAVLFNKNELNYKFLAQKQSINLSKLNNEDMLANDLLQLSREIISTNQFSVES